MEPTRDVFIAAMTTFVDRLAHNEAIPVPQMLKLAPLTMSFGGDDASAQLHSAVAALEVPFTAKIRTSSSGGVYLHLDGDVGGIPIRLTAPAEQVCERVVTGSYQAGGQTHERVLWVVPDSLIPSGNETANDD